MQNDVIKELGTNFIEYEYAVNSDRAIPDAKSGLKPVAKRILWSAYEKGYLPSKPHVKAARIVGDTMSIYHPHGDSSIYGAMVRLSQNWVMRYPLIDWHGSNGTIAGDGPAAMRYTEAKLSKITVDGLLNGIKKRNVDFIPNYDETQEEPLTLPAIFPNLLCNPNSGIGVAMASSWAPHNLRDVAEVIYAYMDGKELPLLAPDFPTGGVVINKDVIPSIMATGKGSIKIRGKYKIEKNKIIFYEIPYGQTIEGILADIGEICEAKEIEGIIDAHDETNKKGIRIVIECGKGVLPESIIPKLFAKTKLQSSFSYNQVALVDKVPTELNLRDCIKIYLDHNIDCLIREKEYDIAEATKRKEIVDGLLKALANIDDIIALIKKSESSAAARESLIKIYSFTENQAKAILGMRLSSLAKLEGVELNNERAELEKNLADWNDIIQNHDRQINIIRTRLQDLVKKYGDDRRTDLMQIDIKPEEKEIEEVNPVDVVVVATQSGLIKKIPTSSYRVQRKGGKGVKSQDAILDVIKTNTVDYLLFFSNKGKMYRTIVDNIPDGTNVSRGGAISDFVKLDDNEKIIAITSLHRATKPKFAIFCTKNGMIKKTYLEEYFKTKRNSGIAAINLKEGDSVAEVIFQDEEELILISKKGMSIRFASKGINAVGRVALGVKGISLADEDELVAALPIHKNTDTVGIFTTNGLGKRVAMKEFQLQSRGGKGTIVYKTSEANGDIAGAVMLDDEDNILLVGNVSSICISAKDVPSVGKMAQGNILTKNRVSHIVKM